MTWEEKDHPRNPKNGEFVDAPGPGWAGRISDQIGQTISPRHAAYLTRGHTTDESTIAYAGRFGWGQPW